MRVMRTAGWIATVLCAACGGADFTSEELFDDASTGASAGVGGSGGDGAGLAGPAGSTGVGGESGVGGGGGDGSGSPVGSTSSSVGPGTGGGGEGGGVESCGASNCAGCCDSNNTCQPGASDDACGEAGGACATCEDACGAPGAMIANGTYCGTQANPAPAVLWITCQAGSCEPHTDASGSWGACCSFQQTCEAGACES